MEYSEVLKNAKEKIGPKCKVCPECNGLGCGNTLPGPGSKGPGNGANVNYNAWRNIRLNMDTIVANTQIDTSINFLGRKLELPILSAPIGSIRLQFNPTAIIVDGGIRSGLDIFKALALGANACMICRPVLISYYGGGQEGIECYFDKLKNELTDTMYMCGARNIADINREMIRF